MIHPWQDVSLGWNVAWSVVAGYLVSQRLHAIMRA